MMVFAYTLIVLLVITSVLLTLLILLHRGKGGGLSSMFGGGVSSSLAGSSAAEVIPPPLWDCPRCGLPAGPDEAHPPEPPRTEPYKTHLAYVKERRSEADGAAILAEALARLKQRRGD